MASHLPAIWNEKKRAVYGVNHGRKKKYSILKANDETFIKLGEILFNL